MVPRPPLDELISLLQATVAAEGVTTDAGDGAGNSFIDAGLIGVGDNSFLSMLAVLYPGQPRLVDSFDITGFDNLTGEVTLSTSYKGAPGAIPAGVPYKIVTFRFVPAEVAALEAKLDLPIPNAGLNTRIAEVIGNEASTAVYVKTNTADIIRYLKGLLDVAVIATGTFTTSSATAPIDSARAEATGWFNNRVIMPLTGACAFQPRVVRQYTYLLGTGGTFAIDEAFTAATGNVAYVILSFCMPASRLRQIQGGTESLESLDDELDAMLDMARYPLSGITTMTGAELVVYTQSDVVPFYFAGGSINLENMAADDSAIIKVYIKQVSGGGWKQVSDDTVNLYTGVTLPVIKMVDPMFNQYGVKITVQQVLHGTSYKDVICEFFDGRRST